MSDHLEGLYDIPKESLQNLECYTTFWDDMERLEKFTNRCLDREKAQENPLNSNVSNVQIINQEEKVDTKYRTASLDDVIPGDLPFDWELAKMHLPCLRDFEAPVRDTYDA
ncbi:hypothetical protein P8452_59446 [Trifolium repens]|nr:hypothetical protein P8452_59446 [Trifolium repens]